MAYDRLIPAKANRVLNLILLFFLLILIRVGYLSIFQYEEWLERSRQPKRRSEVEHTERATIRDRFNIPLATNQIQYKVGITYADIRQIPSYNWEVNASGIKKKIPKRGPYITRLSELLGSELGMDAHRIEDLIHSKASLFPHAPYFIQSEISEACYYRLKMLAKDWAGIHVEKGYKRIYPLGKTASDIIGYMGSISDQQHLALAQEIKELKEYLEAREQGETPILPKGFDTPIEVRERLKELKEKSYTLNDLVGKAGIEATCEEQLRGFYKKNFYEVDRLGTILRELPGSKKAISGQRVVLSLSAELQEFAESLLASKEGTDTTPWIKGGAIVAIHPKTGEILALASHPRFDPNDFSQKNRSLLKWIENETYIGEIWDGKRELEREIFRDRQFIQETLPLTWPRYLSLILNPESKIYHTLQSIKTISDAIAYQAQMPCTDPLAIDLCRLAAHAEEFDPSLLKEVGALSLATHHQNRQIAARSLAFLRPLIQRLYHTLDFQKWREEHFKEYLRLKRREEKQNKKYPRPYLDYLDLLEKQMFQTFWETNRLYFLDAYLSQEIRFSLPLLEPYWEALSELALSGPLSLTLPPHLSLQYLKTLHPFEELKFPLTGKYRHLNNFKKEQTGKDLAAGFYPLGGYGYGRSQAFRQSTPQGSLFKLVVAYEALMEKYRETHHLLDYNPLTLIDDWHGDILGYRLNGETITRSYKGGRLPRSSHSHIGKVDLLGAIEQSSNIYFSLLAAEILQNPAHLSEVARQFSLGKKTGIELPGEIAGNLPDDLAHNKTAIYSFAIGQHSLVVTPLQTAVMLAAIANGGEVIKPKIIKLIAGHEPSEQVDLLFSPHDFPFKKELSLVGLHFPLFTESLTLSKQSHIALTQKEIHHHIDLPPEVRRILLQGMKQVVSGARGTARPAAIRPFFDSPHDFQDYLASHTHLVGKTGTAEILYKPTLDSETKAHIENHVWFGGIAFDQPVDDTFNAEPELVVVVYLRFGGGGKEAAPLAAQIVQKWRELQMKYGSKIGNRSE